MSLSRRLPASQRPSTAICRAIASELESRKMLKKDLAAALEVDPSSVTHLLIDREPDLATIGAIERFFQPDAPRGWLLVKIGMIHIPHNVEDLILIDKRLTGPIARLQRQSYLFALSMSEAEFEANGAKNDEAIANRRPTSARRAS